MAKHDAATNQPSIQRMQGHALVVSAAAAGLAVDRNVLGALPSNPQPGRPRPKHTLKLGWFKRGEHGQVDVLARRAVRHIQKFCEPFLVNPAPRRHGLSVIRTGDGGQQRADDNQAQRIPTSLGAPRIC